MRLIQPALFRRPMRESEAILDDDFTWTNRAEKLLVVDWWWRQQQGMCCICTTEMEPYHRESSSNPMAATIEHVVPIREGGANTVANNRLAHRMCNNALGSLWAINNQRERKGLPPLTPEWALGRAKEQWEIKQARDAAIRAGEPAPPAPLLRFPLPDDTLIEKTQAMPVKPGKIKMRHAPRFLGRPRGSTLPGYIPDTEDAPLPPRVSVAPPRSVLMGSKPARTMRQPLCTTCGSADVTMDASLRWDWNEQAWVIHEHRTGFDCFACDSDTAIRWESNS